MKEFVVKDSEGHLHLEKTVSVGGLGGSPYRDGSYAYYLSEPLKRDDLKQMNLSDNQINLPYINPWCLFCGEFYLSKRILS